MTDPPSYHPDNPLSLLQPIPHYALVREKEREEYYKAI